MKDKINLYLSRAKDKNRLYGYLHLIFSICLIFLFFVPVFCTFVQGEKESILGYYSFEFMNDSFDIIHYAISILIISIILSICLFITSITTILVDETSLAKAKNSNLIVLALKTITDIILLIVADQTKTNIQLDWGGYILPAIDIVFFGISLYFKINDKKKIESTEE